MPAFCLFLCSVSACIDKKVFTGCCCNDICKEKATSGYYHLIFPPFSWIFHVWPFFAFFTICAYLWATPWTHLPFYWQKCYHWVRLQWNLRRKSYSRLLLPHSPTIFLKIPFFGHFDHFSPFVPACGQPLDPISAFIDKNVITGCCCNDIYGERATSGCYHSIPHQWPDQ